MRPGLTVSAVLALATLARAGAPPLDQAIALYDAKRYPEARAALERVLAAEPNNAEACYYLGETLLCRGDANALDDAVPWLEKALKLDPNNPSYLADFGGASIELAEKHTSLSAAVKGRDALEKAVALEPDNLEARTGLMQFYERAPWPLGSSAKAAAQLEEIRRRDPDRALVLMVVARANAQDYAGAFKLCDEVLARRPDDYNALYQYGRTAAASGQNFERALACLKKCLTLPVPGPSAPTYSSVWHRIGLLQERFGHPAEARAAYETAFKLDQANKPAAEALARLK
jgi:tetratricopeptide (TPR) repeat protein